MQLRDVNNLERGIVKPVYSRINPEKGKSSKVHENMIDVEEDMYRELRSEKGKKKGFSTLSTTTFIISVILFSSNCLSLSFSLRVRSRSRSTDSDSLPI